MNHNGCRVDTTTDMQHNGDGNSGGRRLSRVTQSIVWSCSVTCRMVLAGKRIDPVSNPVSISLTGIF